MDRWFDHLMPIIAQNQVSRGGSIVLVQLENEHPQGWGTDNDSDPYFANLRDKAKSLGMEVPWFYSGLHHSSDPAGDTALLDEADRPNPWMSTEFWSVWYDKYGPHPKDASDYARRTWKIISRGGNGYNYYMAFGGSNFGYTNNDEDAASYDYGSAIGQAGDLRPIYYEFKRAAWFARSFQDILENSDDDTASYASVSSNPAIGVSARKSPAGSIVFFDNKQNDREDARIVMKSSGGGVLSTDHLVLEPGEIAGFVKDFELAPGVMIKWSPARIFGIARNGDTTTLIVYGSIYDHPQILFQTQSDAQSLTSAPNVLAGGNIAQVEAAFTDTAPNVYDFQAGGQHIRILAVTRQQLDRTWIDREASGDLVVYGPKVLNGIQKTGKGYALSVEKPWNESQSDLYNTQPSYVFSASLGPTLIKAGVVPVKIPSADTLRLSPWKVKSAFAPAEPAFDDTAWFSSEKPQQMGEDGDTTDDAWYRATFDAPESDYYSIQDDGPGGDRSTVYLDGKKIDGGSIWSGKLGASISSGKHVISVFVAHDGRNKLVGYVGRIDNLDVKGLSGSITLLPGKSTDVNVTGWKVLPASSGKDLDNPVPVSSDERWKNYAVGDDAFSGGKGFAWFETSLTVPEGSKTLKLHFESVDDAGTVFVNGKKVGYHTGWNEPFSINVDPSLLNGGNSIKLDLFVENTDGPGGLDKPVSLTTSTGAPIVPTAWKMKGGPGDPDAAGYTLMTTSLTASNSMTTGLTGIVSFMNGPAFYQTTFNAPVYAASGPHPIWRVQTTGLGHGSVWVDGHNLGRYPEKIPAPGLYIPECWLKGGENILTIYDEDGASPTQVSVEYELNASHTDEVLTSGK
jgi:beta-galactosidase